MRFISFIHQGQRGLAIRAPEASTLTGVLETEADYPGDLDTLVRKGEAALRAAAQTLSAGRTLDLDAVQYAPPLQRPNKIICIGLNYRDHASESGFQAPDYPTVFTRFTSSLSGHGQPIVRPACSVQLDYEGELAAIIGKPGRHIRKDDALSHILGYALFNDASIRDYQFKSPQWTVGKNFDGTGAFGPEFVSADELPPGAGGLGLRTRLNAQVVQQANTSDMIFDIASLISILSEAFTLEAGDVIVTGTPAGVGMARKPQLFMQHGDVCTIEIEGFLPLRNPIVDETSNP